MIPIVSIVGRSGSGKTTLLEKVVAELKKKGYRVGTVKHDVHGFKIDYEGKDSWRHKKAGARAVVLSSPKKVALIRDVDKELSLDRLRFELLPNDLDIVITEGYKKAKNPKIEVVRRAVSQKPVCPGDKNLVAIASDARFKGGVPHFDINDYKGIANFLEERFLKSPPTVYPPPEASGGRKKGGGDLRREGKGEGLDLLVDGRIIPLKPFIENLLAEAISGMVKSLRGCKRAKEIEIKFGYTD